MRIRRHRGSARFLALAAALAAAACGQTPPEQSQPQVTVTATATTTATVAPSTQAPETVSQPPSDTATVPDVVGLDHQLAQDTLQAAGYYLLAEEDVTGQGRVIAWDRNWVVVEQSPVAGTAAPRDATITLRSRKKNEP
ncbi:PASTA domain-containing protein [Herbidospora mongoliensis]|uniref:PASTA domain-containing protein n=1 Tax=Herbidospora mongoliensis TaxID=688067 RepID=UPI0008338962|nr:PASTA domain-containing protein [Herbidospora mongoliensis]